MICVFDIGNTTYTGNGNAVLQPTECKLQNIAGGNYDLTMTHPIDPEGKWKHLVPGAIIRSPVPEEEIENAFAGYDVDVYKTTAETALREGASEPTRITYRTWQASNWTYVIGDRCTYAGLNYECILPDPKTEMLYNHPPDNYPMYWKEIPLYTSGSPALVTLPAGTELYFVEDYDTDWYKMSTYYGIVGYIKKDKVEYFKHLTPSETKPRIIKTQLFRIEKPTVDTKNRTVSVTAKHVSYDLSAILVKDVSISQASPAMALGRITDGLMMDYAGTIATNLQADENGTYTQDIKGKNGMFALLDPDKGIVSTFNAAFKRDNWDLFVMTRTETDRGFRIRYRKNMLGVNWAQDASGMILRVVPVAKNAEGGDLYLPEMWVDSPHINEYPVVRMERLTVKGQVGKAKENGGDETWTESDLLEEMRTKAAERFSVDKADRVSSTVTVDFEQAGATEEYREYRGLEKVLLYDTVRVENEEIGLGMDLYVSEWEYDAIREKMLAVKLVNTVDYKKGTVTGYNVQSKSIGSDKLSDDVAAEILSQAQDMMPEYQDGENYGPTSDAIPMAQKGAADGVATLDSGGKVPASELPSYVDDVLEFASKSAFPATGESGKIYVAIDTGKTYRWSGSTYIELSTTAVTDSDPTLSWGTRSKVGEVAGTGLHVTMPGNPVDGLQTDTTTPTDSDYTVKVGSPSKKITFAKVWAYIKSKLGISSSGSTAKYLDEQGNWTTPTGTYSLPTASSSTKGGIKTGYTQSGKNYPVQMSGENAYVNVPWTDHYAWSDITGKPNGSALTNLGSTTAANVMADDPRPGVTGTLPISNGGTGKTNRKAAYTNLECGETYTTNPDTALENGVYRFSGVQGASIPGDNGTNSWGGIKNFICGSEEAVAVGESSNSSWLWQWGYNTRYQNPFIRYSINGAAFSAWKRIIGADEAIKNITRNGTTFTATRADGTTFTFTQQDNNTWNANSKDVAGYVAAPGAVANKVWKTDANGNPAWRDDADTKYTLPLAANGTRGGVQIGYSQNDKNYPVQLDSEKMFVNVPWTDHYAWNDITNKPYMGYWNIGMGGSIAWQRLGTFTGAQAANCWIHLVSGAGYNGRVEQNAVLDIHIREGNYGSNPNPLNSIMFGATVLRYGEAASSFEVRVIGTAYNICEVWVKMPAYSNGFYLVQSSYTTGWTHSGTTQTTDPSGVQQSIAHYDVTKSIKNITRSGSTYTATRLDGGTFTFDGVGVEDYGSFSNSGVIITVPAGRQMILVVLGANSTDNGMFLVTENTSGTTIVLFEIKKGSNLYASTSGGNRINLSLGSTNTSHVYGLLLKE